jgi:hypothetical protein
MEPIAELAGMSVEELRRMGIPAREQYAQTYEREYGIGARDWYWAHECHDTNEYYATTTGHAYARMRRAANEMRRRAFAYQFGGHHNVPSTWSAPR